MTDRQHEMFAKQLDLFAEAIFYLEDIRAVVHPNSTEALWNGEICPYIMRHGYNINEIVTLKWNDINGQETGGRFRLIPGGLDYVGDCS